jgi:glycosyltransferase involved in cell wall biosynthesis
MGRNIVLSSGGPEIADLLVICGSHPFPARKAEAVRVGQYIRWLRGKGLRIDLAVLSDAPSIERDRAAAEAALRHVRKVVVVRAPAVSWMMRLASRLLGKSAGPHPGVFRAPGRLVREVRRRFGRMRYRAVMVSGAGLGRAAEAFRPSARIILDAATIWHDRYRSYAALGRGAEMAGFADPRREAWLAGMFDAVLALCDRDAALLGEMGVRVPRLVAPFAAMAMPAGSGRPPAGPGSPVSGEPARPPRILFVSSDAADKLDGFRHFRARAFPTIRKLVPSCRLKVVGMAAHLLDPMPGLELAGWSDRLAEEYREAAAVVVPSRMAGGLKVQAVEALAHGKALIATSAAVREIDLVPGRDAVVSDHPAELARQAVRVMTDDSFRRSLESSARALAGRLFDPDLVFAPLLALLEVEGRRSQWPKKLRTADCGLRIIR